MRDRGLQQAEQGTPVQVHLGEGMIHVWPLLPIAEAQSARAVLARAIGTGYATGFR